MGDNRAFIEPMQAADLHTIAPTHQEISLRFATRQDLPDLAQILTTCFLDFELHDQFFTNRHLKQEEYYLFLLARLRMYFIRPSARFMLAERTCLSLTATSISKKEILGFAVWDAEGSANPIRKVWTDERSGWLNILETSLVAAENMYHRYAINTMFNYPLWNQCAGRLAQIPALEPYKSCSLHLQFLAVNPQWQKGHGIGKKLLKWGMDVSDKTGVPVVIDSSLAGEGFYLRNGCEGVAKVRMDFVEELEYEMPILVYDSR